jgi:hypothetical protein
MTYNYKYQTISDAFTKSTNPAVALDVFDSMRDNLDKGHKVNIALSDGQILSFAKINDFEEWVKNTFS